MRSVQCANDASSCGHTNQLDRLCTVSEESGAPQVPHRYHLLFTVTAAHVVERLLQGSSYSVCGPRPNGQACNMCGSMTTIGLDVGIMQASTGLDDGTVRPTIKPWLVRQVLPHTFGVSSLAFETKV